MIDETRTGGQWQRSPDRSSVELWVESDLSRTRSTAELSKTIRLQESRCNEPGAFFEAVYFRPHRVSRALYPSMGCTVVFQLLWGPIRRARRNKGGTGGLADVPPWTHGRRDHSASMSIRRSTGGWKVPAGRGGGGGNDRCGGEGGQRRRRGIEAEENLTGGREGGEFECGGCGLDCVVRHVL